MIFSPLILLSLFGTVVNALTGIQVVWTLCDSADAHSDALQVFLSAQIFLLSHRLLLSISITGF